MLQTGRVVACEGGQLTIEFDRPEACEHCGQCDGHRHAHRVTLPGAANPGDCVTVEMLEGRVAQASLLAYAVPLGCMLLGLLISGKLGPALAPGLSADLFAALCALIGLLVAFAYLRIVDRHIRGKRQWTPRILSIEPANEPAEASAPARREF